jgi:hypothetical protein
LLHSDPVLTRRNLLKGILTTGVFPGLLATPARASAVAALFDQENPQTINPEPDTQAVNFWSTFLEQNAEPAVAVGGQARGGAPSGDGAQPVFWYFGPGGFKNAAEVDAGKLIAEGDVMVSVNTSTVKIAAQDQETFRQLQNAQIRVDVAQRTALLPIIEAMAYTVVGAMSSTESKGKGKTGKSKSSAPGRKSMATVQNISVDSDAAWQKMQDIPLPGGEGRWALNLEAQRKDSLFAQVFQNLLKEAGQFAPVIGLPGIAMSALQSFNTLYGALHSRPVSIIRTAPTRVFATQEALQRTGAPGAVSGILLQSGTYVLVPAKQSPPADELNKYTVTQGRVVPPKTAPQELDEAAANTLREVTYVTFDVEVKPASLLGGGETKKSG